MPFGVNITNDVFLSVVAPAYNEAENLEALVSQAAEALASLNKKWEMLIVNDGSIDETAAVLRKLMKIYPQLRVISLKNRSGQTAGIDAGLRNARGRYIAVLDADLQNDPADIPRMLEKIVRGECDMVSGWRVNRKDKWIRHISSRIANTVRNRLTNEQIHDSACGLKVFKRECLADVKLFTGMHRFLPTLARMEGFRVMELGANHRPRIAGKAKYGVWNRVFKALRDTFAIRWMQKRMISCEFEEWER